MFGTQGGIRTHKLLGLNEATLPICPLGCEIGASWKESNLVPGRDLVYSQTAGHPPLLHDACESIDKRL